MVYRIPKATTKVQDFVMIKAEKHLQAEIKQAENFLDSPSNGHPTRWRQINTP